MNCLRERGRHYVVCVFQQIHTTNRSAKSWGKKYFSDFSVHCVSQKTWDKLFNVLQQKGKLRFLTTWQRCKWMENEFPLINFLTGISLIKLFYCFLMGITLSPSALPLLEMITDGTLLTSSVDVWNYLKLTEWLWGNWWIARVEKAT